MLDINKSEGCSLKTNITNSLKGCFEAYPTYLNYNNYTRNNDTIHQSNCHTDSTQEIYDEQRSVSPQCRSPVGSDFSENLINLNLHDELFMKTKQIETLKAELESVSKLYSDENLRQLEEMNRLIAVILEEKHQSTDRLERKIREQHNEMNLLSKKLASKNSLIDKLNEENMLLRKCSNFHMNKTPVNDRIFPTSNKMVEYNPKYSPSSNTQISSEKKRTEY